MIGPVRRTYALPWSAVWGTDLAFFDDFETWTAPASDPFWFQPPDSTVPIYLAELLAVNPAQVVNSDPAGPNGPIYSYSYTVQEVIG